MKYKRLYMIDMTATLGFHYSLRQKWMTLIPDPFYTGDSPWKTDKVWYLQCYHQFKTFFKAFSRKLLCCGIHSENRWSLVFTMLSSI